MWNPLRRRPRRDIAGSLLTVVADAAIATSSIAHGRMLPLVILDTSSRVDIEQLVSAQATLPPGDVETVWGRTESGPNPSSVYLICDFHRPVRCSCAIEFEVPRQSILVDLALGAHGLYLQPGRPGDKLSRVMDRPKILIEIEGDFPDWNDLYRRAVVADMRRRGLSRKVARRAAPRYIEEQRKLFNVARKHQY